MRVTDTAIIGAGPYGLSLATHLTQARFDYRIFGQPMQFWEQTAQAGNERYLKSFCFGTNLATPDRGFTFRDFNEPRGLETLEPCSIANFAAYGRWFQSHNVPTVEPIDVKRVAKRAEGYEVTLANGAQTSARRVVVATGLAFFDAIPQVLAGLCKTKVTHTSRVTDFASYAGQTVAVIGAGQSALEAAALLREAHAFPKLVVRADAIRWNTQVSRAPSLWRRVRSPLSVLGTGPKAWALAHFPGAMHRLPSSLRRRLVKNYLPPEGAWWLRKRVEDLVPTYLSHSIVDATQSKKGVRLVLEHTSTGVKIEIFVDHVIAGTGYAIDVSRIPFLDADLTAGIARVNGAPRLNRVFESSQKGLHFIGPVCVPSFGPLFRFVAGASYTSHVLAHHLAKTASIEARSLPRDTRISELT